LLDLDDLDPVGREELTDRAGRFAARVRLEIVLLAALEQALRPGLEGDVVDDEERPAPAVDGHPQAGRLARVGFEGGARVGFRLSVRIRGLRVDGERGQRDPAGGKRSLPKAE